MSQDPFFVVGTGRSGTTMFRNLLRSHPVVFVPKETHWLPILWNEFGQRDVPTEDIQSLVDRVYMAKGRTSFERIARELDRPAEDLRAELKERLGPLASVRDYHAGLLNILASSRERSVLGDKTPDYGLAMTSILELFPEARFVHVMRDGRDVAMSMSKVLSFRILAALGLTNWWSVALDGAYRSGLKRARETQPLEAFLRLWHRRVMRILDEATRIPGDRMLAVRYEDLLDDPKLQLKRVQDFLDLPGTSDWIDEASLLVRRDNRSRNENATMRSELTALHATLLTEAGYQP